MRHYRVDSSTISHIGYDENSRELHVAFHGSSPYIYSDVPPEKFKEFMESESKGKFLHQNIKEIHAYRKIDKK